MFDVINIRVNVSVSQSSEMSLLQLLEVVKQGITPVVKYGGFRSV